MLYYDFLRTLLTALEVVLKTVWRFLQLVGYWIGQVQTWLLLTLVYVIAVAPVALLYKLWADPLRLRSSSTPLWHPRAAPPELQTWAKSQF